MYKIYLIDKSELKKGEHEEETEHGFSPDVAIRTAKDHLEKKDPHYYTKLDKLGLEEEQLEEYKSGFGSGKMGSSKDAQGIPTGKNFPFTQKSGRLWKIKMAAKKGPVVAVGAGFGPMEENKD
jgi:hypothetical protein